MNRLSFATGLLALFATVQAFGQTTLAKGTVPFSFQLSGKVMPAGTYVVSESRGLVTLEPASGKSRIMFMTRPTERKVAHEDPSLEFHRYGNEYFLSNIWRRQSKEGLVLYKSKHEKELIRRTSFVQTRDVAFVSNPGALSAMR